ncbi:MAG: tRNA-dihydrouridine synthase family protein [Nanoarchaeota archaeon]
MKIKSLNISKIKLKNRLFLAPMVDVTDLPYRLVCKKAGAGMTYTEMIYVSAIIHENPKTKQLMQTSSSEKPSAIQITGNNPEEFNEVLPFIKNYDLVDINCGCPSVRIVGNQAGSYLLKDPEKIAKMIKILKSAGHIVTVKIRLGFHINNVMKIAKTIEKAGADALTIHARLGIHGNKIPADWKEIAKVKKELKIPVIGNGDVSNPEKVKEMLKVADGAMIARAAIGDPDIFQRSLIYLKTGTLIPYSFDRNKKYLKMYLTLCKKYHKIPDLPRVKYLACSFIKGIPNGAKIRNAIMLSKDIDSIEKSIFT